MIMEYVLKYVYSFENPWLNEILHGPSLYKDRA